MKRTPPGSPYQTHVSDVEEDEVLPKSDPPQVSATDPGYETPLIPECDTTGYVKQLAEKVQAAMAIITDPSCRATKDQQIRLQKELIGVLSISNMMALEMGKLEGALSVFTSKCMPNKTPTATRAWNTVAASSTDTSCTQYPCLPLITRNNALPGPARPSVLVFPANNTQSTSKATMKTLKTAVNPATLGIRVTGVRELKSGGVIIHPSTSAEATKLANDPAISEAGLKATIAPNRLPRIAIHDLPQDISSEDIIMAIHHQSSIDTGLSLENLKENISFSHKSGPRTGNCIHIFRVPSSVRHSLISRTKLAIDWQLHRVRDWVDSLKCGHCQLYGHIASKCQADLPTCSHCAKVGHNRDACPKKEKSPLCATCTFFRKPATHKTGAQDCPGRQAAERRELSRINFLG